MELFSTEESTKSRIRENNQVRHTDITLNREMTGFIHRIRHYKRYNLHGYREGKKYLKMFHNNLQELMREDMAHPRQVFENAQSYLNLSLNHFQSLIFSIPEVNYNSTLRYNKTSSHKITKNISEICKDLHKHCYSLLHTMALKLNQDFHEHPDIYKGEIRMSTDEINPSNTYDSHELY